MTIRIGDNCIIVRTTDGYRVLEKGGTPRVGTDLALFPTPEGNMAIDRSLMRVGDNVIMYRVPSGELKVLKPGAAGLESLWFYHHNSKGYYFDYYGYYSYQPILHKIPPVPPATVSTWYWEPNPAPEETMVYITDYLGLNVENKIIIQWKYVNDMEFYLWMTEGETTSTIYDYCFSDISSWRSLYIKNNVHIGYISTGLTYKYFFISSKEQKIKGTWENRICPPWGFSHGDKVYICNNDNGVFDIINPEDYTLLGQITLHLPDNTQLRPTRFHTFQQYNKLVSIPDLPSAGPGMHWGPYYHGSQIDYIDLGTGESERIDSFTGRHCSLYETCDDNSYPIFVEPMASGCEVTEGVLQCNSAMTETLVYGILQQDYGIWLKEEDDELISYGIFRMSDDQSLWYCKITPDVTIKSMIQQRPCLLGINFTGNCPQGRETWYGCDVVDCPHAFVYEGKVIFCDLPTSCPSYGSPWNAVDNPGGCWEPCTGYWPPCIFFPIRYAPYYRSIYEMPVELCYDWSIRGWKWQQQANIITPVKKIEYGTQYGMGMVHFLDYYTQFLISIVKNTGIFGVNLETNEEYSFVTFEEFPELNYVFYSYSDPDFTHINHFFRIIDGKIHLIVFYIYYNPDAEEDPNYNNVWTGGYHRWGEEYWCYVYNIEDKVMLAHKKIDAHLGSWAIDMNMASID